MTEISPKWTNSSQSHSNIGFTAANLEPPTAAPSSSSTVPEAPGPAASSSPNAVAVTVFVSLYATIFAVGLIGNGLVVFVVCHYSTMKTVVNRLILNLSVADGAFVLGLPLVITTSLVRRWVFGAALCKIYYALTCVNMFTGSFTLAVMSADRFAAVYFPLGVKRYRTPRNVVYVIAVTWFLSLVAMTPAVMFANSVPRVGTAAAGGYSCTIEWPADTRAIARIYIVYTFVLGFLVPTIVIALSYTLVVIRLRTNTTRMWRRGLSGGSGGESGQRRESSQSRGPGRRNVTRLVFLIVLVYAVCWSPYWSFQVYQIAGTRRRLKYSEVLVFNVFTVLSYANSAVNPLLYAFTNDRFRKSFASAFGFGFGRRGPNVDRPQGTGEATAGGTRRGGGVARGGSGRERPVGGARKAVGLETKPSADGVRSEIEVSKTRS